MSDETFRFDNSIIQAAPAVFGSRIQQMYLPGMEPLGPFDLWATLACFSLLDLKDPKKAVRVTLTEFAERLQFARIVSEALGDNRTFESDVYKMIRESLHRLFTVEVVFAAQWNVKTGKRGRPKKQYVEIHSRILASYAYIYPPTVTPPEHLAESKRKNVNKAKTTDNEPGPPIWQLADGPRPDAIEIRVSEELLRGLTRTNPHIGATVFPVKLFELRRKIPSRDSTTIKLILWVCRQTANPVKIRLDNLVKGIGLTDRNVARNRETTLKSLDRIKGFGVIEKYSHNEKSDLVTIKKADDWHFPIDRDAELADNGA